MKKLLCLGAILLLEALQSPRAPAQTKKTKIIFECSCDDPIASRYATEVRDLIAASPRYAEGSARETDANGKLLNQWGISVVAAPFQGATAISIAFTYGGLLADHNVQVCGTNKVKECAATALSLLDALVTKDRL